MRNQTLCDNISYHISVCIFVVLFCKMNTMVEKPKVVCIKSMYFFVHSPIFLILSMFNLFSQLTSNKLCFLYLENQNGCTICFAKLNAIILTLCIREKSNDIDCNRLTSENHIQLSKWQEECSNVILSPNLSFGYSIERSVWRQHRDVVHLN